MTRSRNLARGVWLWSFAKIVQRAFVEYADLLLGLAEGGLAEIEQSHAALVDLERFL